MYINFGVEAVILLFWSEVAACTFSKLFNKKSPGVMAGILIFLAWVSQAND
jgi:hypothetical protein